ncbi:MAG: response regulator, partial [Thermoproteota archaeon]
MSESNGTLFRATSEFEEGGIRILHVDDDSGFLKTTKELLKMQGDFQVETTTSVKEALKKVDTGNFDAVVSDYQMPDRDGLDFLEELKERGESIPFIMFTGKGKEEVAMEALNLGADRYLNKGGDPETVYGELAHSIKKAVNNKRMEEALRQSERMYRLLAENITDLIFVLDVKLKFKYASPSAESLLEYTPREVKELRLKDIMTPNSYERTMRTFREAISVAEAKPDFELPLMQYQFVRKDGSTFWGEVNLKFLRDQKGRVEGVQGTLRDISSRKMAEEA